MEDYGWSWVVVVGALGSNCIIGVTVYSTGIFHLALLERFKESDVQTAWVGALLSSMVTLTAPLASIIIDRFSCRVAMVTSGVLYLLAFVGTAFTSSLQQCLFTLGILAGFAGGIGYTTALVVIGYNFRRKLNLASGISLAGVGFGIFGLSPAVQAAKETYGFSGMFLIVAGIGFHNCVFGALFRKSNIEIEKTSRRHVRSKANNNAMATLLNSSKEYFQVYSRPCLLCFSTSFLWFAFATYLVFYHLPSFYISTGMSQMDASWLLSISGVVSCLSRVLIGLSATSGSFDELTIYFSFIGILSIMTLIYPMYADSYATHALYSAILGAYLSGCYAMLNEIIRQLVGVHKISHALGMLLFFCGVGNLAGPVVGGLMVENGFSYNQAFVVAGVAHALSSVLGMVTSLFKTEYSLVREVSETTELVDVENERHHVTRNCRSADDHIEVTAESSLIMDIKPNLAQKRS